MFLFLPNTGLQRVLNFMRDPKLAHILVLNLVPRAAVLGGGGGVDATVGTSFLIKSLK